MLQKGITVKCVIGNRYHCSEHQQYDALEVQLHSQRSNYGTVIYESMETIYMVSLPVERINLIDLQGRKCKTYSHARKECAKGENVTSGG